MAQNNSIVDQKYRIHAADLQGKRQEWIVTNVSFQGVEDLSPVLHLQGMTKRFVLDHEQSKIMTSLANSYMPNEWIGARIRVSPVGSGDDEKIVITEVDLPEKRRRLPILGLPSSTRLRRIIWLAFVIILLSVSAAVFWMPPGN